MLTTIPDSNQFKLALLTIQAILLLNNSKIDTKKGSIVRLLLVRPYAYIYTYLNNFINNWIKRSSVAYLKTTLDTEDLIADMVASNYFVTRNLGNKSGGLLLLTLSSAVSYIPTSTKFIIDNNIFLVPKSYIITPLSYLDTLDTTYVKAKHIGNYYKVIIDVLAQLPGLLLIPLGASVSVSSYIQNFILALVFSAISGGKSILTNALLMQRCLLKCGGSVGTLRAITTRLKLTSVDVISCNSIGSMLPGLFRSRYNNLLLPVSGAIDTFVKTRNQPSTKLLYIDNIQDGIIKISALNYPLLAGLYAILSITSLNRTTVLYSISFESMTSDLNALSVRLSNKQLVVITLADKTISSVYIIVKYMPYIDRLQSIIEDPRFAFLGLDILIKAAIPIKLFVSCHITSALTLTLLSILQMKLTIASCINRSSVGYSKLNMTDIALQFSNTYPLAKLRLPYSISCNMLTTQGTNYSFTTNNGIVDTTQRSGLYLWDSSGYFFYTTKDSIDLKVL